MCGCKWTHVDACRCVDAFACVCMCVNMSDVCGCECVWTCGHMLTHVDIWVCVCVHMCQHVWMCVICVGVCGHMLTHVDMWHGVCGHMCMCEDVCGLCIISRSLGSIRTAFLNTEQQREPCWGLRDHLPAAGPGCEALPDGPAVRGATCPLLSVLSRTGRAQPKPGGLHS